MLKHSPGYHRMGVNRQLKKACEQHWTGKTTRNELFAAVYHLHEIHWKKTAGSRHSLH